MTTEEELKKGCGKNLGHWNCGEVSLGSILYLCLECQAELKGIQEGRAEAYKKCIEILSLHNIGIKEVEWRVREYLNEIKGDGK